MSAGDFAYISTVYQNAQGLANAGVNVWKYHFAYPGPNREFEEICTPLEISRLTCLFVATPVGVTHASELAYVSKVSTAPIATVMNDYYSSCKSTSVSISFETDPPAFSHRCW
jgi:transketolase C-terminal domain/subunit